MPLYRKSELIPYLESLGATAKKGLSQNFLVDGNIIDKILTASHMARGDTVLEIGPGPGALTDALIEKGANLIVVEIDRLFAAGIERRGDNVRVIQGDFLKVDLDEILPKGKKIRVIANLPYHITTPILAKIAPRMDLFASLTVMVQEEVGRRMTSKVGSEDYSSLSLFLHYYSDPKYVFRVSRHCFYPEPSVDSAVIHLELKEPPAIKRPDLFFGLTRAAFGKRRKMLRASLESLFPKERIVETLLDLGYSENTRPEELSLDDFLLIYKNLYEIS